METTIIETYNDGSNDVFFKKYADAIRKRRNEILQDTDHKILLEKIGGTNCMKKLAGQIAKLITPAKTQNSRQNSKLPPKIIFLTKKQRSYFFVKLSNFESYFEN